MALLGSFSLKEILGPSLDDGSSNGAVKQFDIMHIMLVTAAVTQAPSVRSASLADYTLIFGSRETLTLELQRLLLMHKNCSFFVGIHQDRRRMKSEHTTRTKGPRVCRPCMFLLFAFGVPRSRPMRLHRSQYARYPQSKVATMPRMAGSAHMTGIEMMKLPAGLDDECVDARLILCTANLQI